MADIQKWWIKLSSKEGFVLRVEQAVGLLHNGYAKNSILLQR